MKMSLKDGDCKQKYYLIVVRTQLGALYVIQPTLGKRALCRKSSVIFLCYQPYGSKSSVIVYVTNSFPNNCYTTGGFWQCLE